MQKFDSSSTPRGKNKKNLKIVLKYLLNLEINNKHKRKNSCKIKVNRTLKHLKLVAILFV